MIDRLQAIKDAFDAGFARPVADAGPAREELIVVNVGPDRYALRLSELRGVERVSRIVPLPGMPSALLGLTGLRGRLVPVFALAPLLGAEARAHSGWIVLAGADEPVALAFDSLEGVREVLTSDIVSAASPDASDLVPQALRADGSLIKVIRVAAVLDALTPQTSPKEEL